MKEINWKERFFKLAEAVRDLSGNSEYSSSEGCNIPMEDDWDFLEKAVDYYSQEKPLKPLKLLIKQNE